jgi:hypothetical protein
MSPRGYRDEDTTPPEADHEDFTLERFCTSKDGRLHGPQLIACQDRSPWIHIMAARQAGKSQADCAILFENARANEGSTNIFLGLKGTGVRFSMWEAVWRPLCERFGLDPKCHNITNMVTTFPNGSRVAFAGTDDLSNVRKYLGNSFVRGVFIIDEAQSQSTTILKYLVENLLPPTLGEGSRVYMTGVLPDAPVGYFYERAEGNAKAEGWSHHEWGRAANVHTPNALEWLANHMREFNIPDDDPQIQRDWYMVRVWDVSSTAFGYVDERNGYDPAPPAWVSALSLPPGKVTASVVPFECNMFLVGIDPAGLKDRYALEVLAFGEATDKLWHCFEWITDKAADPYQSDVNNVLVSVKGFYENVLGWVRDHGSAAITDDTLQKEHGITVEPAIKTDLRARVNRMRDLLRAGRMKVMRGSALAEDFALARWSMVALADGDWKWSWDPAHHPDASDAAVYTLPKYFHYKPLEVPKPETHLQRVERKFREDFSKPEPGANYGYKRDQYEPVVDSKHYGGPSRQ